MDIAEAIERIAAVFGVEVKDVPRHQLAEILSEVHDAGYAEAERHAAGDYDD